MTIPEGPEQRGLSEEELAVIDMAKRTMADTGPWPFPKSAYLNDVSNLIAIIDRLLAAAEPPPTPPERRLAMLRWLRSWGLRHNENCSHWADDQLCSCGLLAALTTPPGDPVGEGPEEGM